MVCARAIYSLEGVKSNSHCVPDSLFHDSISIFKGTSVMQCCTINKKYKNTLINEFRQGRQGIHDGKTVLLTLVAMMELATS